MKARKYFLLFMVLLIFGIMGLDARSEEQPAAESEITLIDVASVDGTTEIRIESKAPFNYTMHKASDPFQVEVELQDTALGEFNDKIVFDRDGVLEITPLTDESSPDIAKLRITLTVPVEVEPVYDENLLILAFDNPEFEETAAAESTLSSEEDTGEPEEEYYEVEDIKEIAETESEFLTKKYVGEKISIDFQDAELIHVFRLIADISGYNIVVSPDVKGKFSMRLTDVPWDQALDVILRNYNLSKSLEGNIIRVAPTSVLSKEEEEIAKAKESQEKAGDLVTKVYAINYADVGSVKAAIDDAKILTKRGFISTDSRTSSVIIKDVDKKHMEYNNLIKALDVPTPQVSIDAKIVEVTTEFQNELGIQWGMLWAPNDENIEIRGPSIPGGLGSSALSPFIVNMPAVGVAPGKGGAIGLGYISDSGSMTLDIQLSAMESSGKGKVISNPKITTSDNQEAKIMQGKKIPYMTVSESGTKTEFMDALLELTVTPHITPEGTIVMNLEAKKNEADFAGPQVLGVPTIDIKEISTQVLIKDNDTLVIGGIFKTNTATNTDEVPGFAKIPFFGSLFRHNRDVDNTDELLIFITPRIVKQM
jgi:type IV pilus secretin PilQ/predicted competence protein